MDSQKQEMINMIASQQKELEYMQTLLDDRKFEIETLTKYDSREQTMSSLHNQFIGMKQMIDDHDKFRKG